MKTYAWQEYRDDGCARWTSPKEIIELAHEIGRKNPANGFDVRPDGGKCRVSMRMDGTEMEKVVAWDEAERLAKSFLEYCSDGGSNFKLITSPCAELPSFALYAFEDNIDIFDWHDMAQEIYNLRKGSWL